MVNNFFNNIFSKKLKLINFILLCAVSSFFLFLIFLLLAKLQQH